MKTSIPNVTLNNGVEIPILGLGTAVRREHGELDEVYTAVREAIKAGYRHIDTASLYETEKEIGRAIGDAIRDGDVTREELFIVTKLWIDSFKFDHVLEAAQQSLAALDLNYIDLYLVHWPTPIKKGSPVYNPEFDDDIDVHRETWRAMEQLVRDRIVKSIGVSNYNAQQIDDLLAVAKIKPVCNQVECHPFLPQTKLLRHCEGRGVKLVAYSALGSSPVSDSLSSVADGDIRANLRDHPTVKELAAKYSKSVGQILLKYQTARGVIVIPKSVTKTRIIENANIFDFTISDEDVKKLDGLESGQRFLHFRGSKLSQHKNFPFNAKY